MSKTNPPAAVIKRALKIKLLLMDVDGVLTDGQLYNVPGPNGEWVETKGFGSQDGIGLQWAQSIGLESGVISGRDSPALVVRARQCRIKYVYQGRLEKIPVYEEILADARLSDESVAYIGDDLTDAPVMMRAGFAVAPANARPEVKQIAHLVTAACGGGGAVREAIELILRSQGKWDQILRKYGVSSHSG